MAKQWISQNAHKSTEPLDQVLLSEKAKALKKKLYEKAITLVKPSHDLFQSDDPDNICIIALSNLPTEMAVHDKSSAGISSLAV